MSALSYAAQYKSSVTGCQSGVFEEGRFERRFTVPLELCDTYMDGRSDGVMR